MQLVFALTLLLAAGARYADDEEHHSYTYYEDDATKPPVESHDLQCGHQAPTSTWLRTLSDTEVSRIKDALKQLLPNHNLDEVFMTSHELTESTTSWYTVKDIFAEILKDLLEEEEDTDVEANPYKSSVCTHQTWSPLGQDRNEYNRIKGVKEHYLEETEDIITVKKYDYEHKTTRNWSSVGIAPARERFSNTELDFSTEEVYVYKTPPYWPMMEHIFDLNKLNRSQNQFAVKEFENMAIDRAKRNYSDVEDNTQASAAQVTLDMSANRLKSSFDYPMVIMGRQDRDKKMTATTTTKKRYKITRRRQETEKSRRRHTRPTRASWTVAPPSLNAAKLVDFLTNLTEDYPVDLMKHIREELDKESMLQYGNKTGPRSAETVTVTTTTTTTEDPYENLTGTVMGKCFVCGVSDPGLPHHARCADAFAGDIIPLIQVETGVRNQLANYRKYCRWKNVPKYIINETDPRSMWGRWTGGCSVRWVDISGIYTQRTCRNRHRAVMGKHWASKRMAKLEMALQNIDNGCIISPMASLVPLSRGISLYARFHACVCTGSWCNRGSPGAQCTWPHLSVLAALSVTVVTTFLLEYREDISRRKIMLFTIY